MSNPSSVTYGISKGIMTTTHSSPSSITHGIPNKKVETVNAETNTNNNNIALINTKKKKKQHNITIKNFNPAEPTIKEGKVLYSDKQKYRKYKTQIEPQLHSKIMIDEEDDLVAKIRKEFGINVKDEKEKERNPETSGAVYTQEPDNPPEQETKFQESSHYRKINDIYDSLISDISNDDIEDLTGQTLFNQYKYNKEYERDDKEQNLRELKDLMKLEKISMAKKPKKQKNIEKQKQEREEIQEKINKLKESLGDEFIAKTIAKTKAQRKAERIAEEKADSIYDYRMLSHFQHRLRESKQTVRDIKSQEAGKEIQRLKRKNKDVTKIEPNYRLGYYNPKIFNFSDNQPFRVLEV